MDPMPILPSPAVTEGRSFSAENAAAENASAENASTENTFLLDGKSNESFNNRLQQLQKFKANHGHLNVSQIADTSLAKWCDSVRSSYHAKERAQTTKLSGGVKLTDERIEALKQMDFQFIHVSGKNVEEASCQRSEDIFNIRLQELQQFKLKHGHLIVTTAVDKSLTNWCHNVRSSYRAQEKGQKGNVTLSDERIAVLKQIGFQFIHDDKSIQTVKNAVNGVCQRSNMMFNNRLKDLQKFKDIHGHLNVTPLLDKSLAKWSHSVKSSYRAGVKGRARDGYVKLTDERIAALKQIGFTFPPVNLVLSVENASGERSSVIFDRRLKELRVFKLKHGHLNVTSTVDKSLARWCESVRSAYRAKERGATGGRVKLTDERIAALKKIGFRMFPKTMSKNDINLYALLRRSNKMFNSRLEELRRFKDVHGHLNVTSQSDKSLATWCSDVRCSYRDRLKGKKMTILLTNERIAALEALGFEFPIAEEKDSEGKAQDEVMTETNPTLINGNNTRPSTKENTGVSHPNQGNKEACIPQEAKQQQQQQQQEQQHVDKNCTQNVEMGTQHDPQQQQKKEQKQEEKQIIMHVPQQQLLAQEPSQVDRIEDGDNTNVMAFEDELMADVTDASLSNLHASYIKPRHYEPHVIEQPCSDCFSEEIITFDDQLDYDRSVDLLSIYENV